MSRVVVSSIMSVPMYTLRWCASVRGCATISCVAASLMWVSMLYNPELGWWRLAWLTINIAVYYHNEWRLRMHPEFCCWRRKLTQSLFILHSLYHSFWQTQFPARGLEDKRVQLFQFVSTAAGFIVLLFMARHNKFRLLIRV